MHLRQTDCGLRQEGEEPGRGDEPMFRRHSRTSAQRMFPCVSQTVASIGASRLRVGYAGV